MCMQGMAQLTKIIFQRAQPKRLGPQVITGPMLATLASEYVQAINEGAVPTISTAWQVSPAMTSILPQRLLLALHLPPVQLDGCSKMQLPVCL